MKRLVYLLLLLPFGVGAQNMYDTSFLLDNDFSGSARFMGMAGSMSALGGDVSVMGVNPAGTALYRSNDFNISASINFNNSEAVFEGIKTECDFTDISLRNFGMVFSNEYKGSDLNFLNFGINYRRKHISSDFDMYGLCEGFSQQYVIRDLYLDRQFDVNKLSYSMYESFHYNWLTLLAAEAYLVDEEGNFLADANDQLAYTPYDMGYYSEERGGEDVVDMNISANFNDVVYIGATLGFHNVDYSRYSYYYEADSYGEIYSIVNNYRVEGNGIDLKLGAIVRPFKYSSFRMGFAFHTPTFYYDLMDVTSASIADPEGYVFDTRDYERYNDDVRLEYKLRTPWRVNASMAYTFANCLAVNAEYEYADYTKSKFTKHTSVSKAQTSEMEYNLKAQHTFRVGAEYTYDGISLRAGYSNQSAPFETTAYKFLGASTVNHTSTEYMNRFDKETVTLGGGYRGDVFYFDVAYVLQSQKADFYPYYDNEYENPAAKVKFMNQSFVATFGMRF